MRLQCFLSALMFYSPVAQVLRNTHVYDRGVRSPDIYTLDVQIYSSSVIFKEQIVTFAILHANYTLEKNHTEVTVQ